MDFLIMLFFYKLLKYPLYEISCTNIKISQFVDVLLSFWLEL